MEKDKLIEEMFKKGILISKEFLEKEGKEGILTTLQTEADLLVLNSDYAEIVTEQTSLVDWYEIDKLKVAAEKDRDDDLYQNQLQTFKKASLVLHQIKDNYSQEQSSLEIELNLIPVENTLKVASFSSIPSPPPETSLSPSPFLEVPSPFNTYPVNIVISYENKPHKYEIKDFTNIFLSRYKFLEKILRTRPEISETLTSIGRVLGKKEKETVSIIGMVEEISQTKNGNVMLTLEDPTGKIKVLISKNHPDLLSEAKEVTEDEVIGISGMCGEKIIFADKIVWPDIPVTNVVKTCPEEIYAIFLSDFHVGSKLFCKEEFERFLQWIQGESGSASQR
ncbi:MAG: OB-fold nucleic acid binding domain-containing protein, partial [Nanoarchaeota archaeon]